jgi:hypothetical protein
VRKCCDKEGLLAARKRKNRQSRPLATCKSESERSKKEGDRPVSWLPAYLMIMVVTAEECS